MYYSDQSSVESSLSRLHFEELENERSVRTKPMSLELDEFAEYLTKPLYRKTKEGAAYIFGRMDGKGRKDENVKSITALVFDLDGKNGVHYQAEELQKRLRGLKCIAHTTFSHTPEAPRWRVIFPLEEDLEPIHLKRAYQQLESLTGIRTDPQTLHPSRLFYRPTCPPECADWYVIMKFLNGEYFRPKLEEEKDELELASLDLRSKELYSISTIQNIQHTYHCVPHRTCRISAFHWTQEMELRNALGQLVVPGSSYLPTGPGQRHFRLLKFVRLVRRKVPDLPSIPARIAFGLLKSAFDHWFHQSRSFIRTKSFVENWREFIEAIFDPNSLSPGGLPSGLTLEQIGEFYEEEDGTFFLSTSTLASYFGCGRSSAHRRIEKLLQAKIWGKVRRGNRYLANVYRTMNKIV